MLEEEEFSHLLIAVTTKGAVRKHYAIFDEDGYKDA